MQTDKNIIVIGDVHGRTLWRSIVERHPECRFVFLGDYCDPYEKMPSEEVVDNLMEIIRLKQSRPDDVVLLLGNHDVHYIDYATTRATRFSLELAWPLREIFTEHADCFQCAYSEQGILFTHAGVSEAWFHQSFVGDADADVVSQLNASPTDQVLCHCGKARKGPHPHGGIYWAGMSEMLSPLRGTVQVVGHTRTDGVERIETGEGVVYYCDCLETGKYLMIEKNASPLQFYEMEIANEEKTLL